jgi:NADH dehydrogenase
MKKLLILGAGYGGLRVAQKLDSLARGRSQWEVTLVDQRDYHLIQVRIHEVAANSIPADKVKIPLSELLEGRNVKFVQARIEKIDPQTKTVQTSAGVLSYDRLVIALGSETAYRNIPGLQEHTFAMKSLEDARAYRRAVIDAFKEAANPDGPALKLPDERLTFIVGGAGLTGTELAAEMVDFCQDLVKHFPSTRRAYKIILLDAANQILPQLDREYGDYVRGELVHKGVTVITGAFIEKVELGTIYLKGGKVLTGKVICWAGGIKAPAILQESGFEVTKDGRIVVDAYLRSKQYPEVYVIGDNALIPDRRSSSGASVPQTGQYAERQGEYVAEALWDEERNLRPHRYLPFTLGTAISLGRTEALTLSGPLRLTGIPGRLAKNVSYDNYEWTIRARPRLLNTR